MHVCVVDQARKTLVNQNVPAGSERFLSLIRPFRKGLVVGCESMFAWYLLADLCRAQKLEFVLGHALSMKAIHGGKTKTDRIDSEKIARLLRGGMFPLAYVYPQKMNRPESLPLKSKTASGTSTYADRTETDSARCAPLGNLQNNRRKAPQQCDIADNV